MKERKAAEGKGWAFLVVSNLEKAEEERKEKGEKV